MAEAAFPCTEEDLAWAAEQAITNNCLMRLSCDGELGKVCALLRNPEVAGNRVALVRGMDKACEHGHLELVEVFLHPSLAEHLPADPCLVMRACSAARSGQEAVLRRLLALEAPRRIDVHARDSIILRVACSDDSDGHEAVLRLVLSLKGERTARLNDGPSWNGVLSLAAAGASTRMLRMLLGAPHKPPLDVARCAGVHLKEAACNMRGDALELLLSLTGERAPDLTGMTAVLEGGQLERKQAPDGPDGTAAFRRVLHLLLAYAGPGALSTAQGKVLAGEHWEALRREAPWTGAAFRAPRRMCVMWRAHAVAQRRAQRAAETS